MMILGFVVIAAGTIGYALYWGQRRARRYAATDAAIEDSFARATSKLGLIIALVVSASIVLLGGLWAYVSFVLAPAN